MTRTSRHGASPAHELLILCAQPRPAPAVRERTRLLARSMTQWDAFLTSAAQHKVLPLVHRALCGAGDACPPAVRAVTDQHLRALRLNHRFMDAELGRLLDRLEAAGVPALVFKGSVLQSMAFTPLGATREYSDIDLLVRPHHYACAKAELLRCGYRMTYDAAHEHAVGQAQLMREDGRVSVDLHTRLAPRRFPGAPDADELWDRVVDCPLGQRTVQTYDADLGLLLVCLQGAKERWSWLSRACDVAWLLAVRSEVSWDALMSDARRLGALRVLLVGLACAQQVLKTELPAGVTAACARDRSVRALSGLVADRLLGCTGRRRFWLHDRHMFHYHLHEGRWQRTAYAASISPQYLRAALSPLRRQRRDGSSLPRARDCDK